MKTVIVVALTICVMSTFTQGLYKNNQSVKLQRKRAITQRYSKRAGMQKVVIDNRSGRKVKLFYVDSTSRIQKQVFHSSVMPNKGKIVYTDRYTWYAKDEQGNRLLLNGRSRYVSVPNTGLEIPIVPVTRPGFPKTVLAEMFIETLLVLDEKSFARFGSVSDARRYAMALLKFTNDIFQDKTLTKHGLRINVVASEILVLQKEDRNLDIDSSNGGGNNLDNSCKFMVEFSKRSKKKFDHMIFLTRKAVGGGAGFAWVKEMCELQSCSIINDHGFHSSFIIAHEIAHSIGLEHQDFPKNGFGYVMTIPVQSRFGNFAWSQYSLAMFLAHVRDYRCLENKATNNNKLPVLHKYIGVYYTYDQQCALANVEPYFKYSLVSDPCGKMLCSKKEFPFYYDINKSPLLDGTECGRNKWCVKGKCQDKTSDIVKAVHGNWGRWSSWTACSRTCDVGERRRKRYCDNPKPLNGGKYCVGLATEISTCNSGNCKGLLDCDFRIGFCSWKSHKDDTGEVEWARKTTGYAYIRATKALSKGKKKARLISPEVTAPHACLTFKYRLYGKNVFRLKVRLESKKRDTGGSLWSKGGNQGTAWKTAKVNIKNKARYQIVIEGIVNGYHIGQTDVREIKFSTRSCPRY